MTTLTTYEPMKVVEVIEVTYSDGTTEDWNVNDPSCPWPISISCKRTVTYPGAALEGTDQDG